MQRPFETWSSDTFALDERHKAQLYARLVKKLVEPHLVRLADRKRAAATASSQEPNKIKTELVSISTSISDAATSTTVYHEHDSTATPREIYSPDMDVSKVSATIMSPEPGLSVSWEKLSPSTGSGVALDDPTAASDVTSTMGDGCLATMMGLGEGAWFLQDWPSAPVF